MTSPPLHDETSNDERLATRVMRSKLAQQGPAAPKSSRLKEIFEGLLFFQASKHR